MLGRDFESAPGRLTAISSWPLLPPVVRQRYGVVVLPVPPGHGLVDDADGRGAGLGTGVRVGIGVGVAAGFCIKAGVGLTVGSASGVGVGSGSLASGFTGDGVGLAVGSSVGGGEVDTSSELGAKFAVGVVDCSPPQDASTTMPTRHARTKTAAGPFRARFALIGFMGIIFHPQGLRGKSAS